MRDIDLKFWMPIYHRIASILDLDISEDRRATLLLNKLASPGNPDVLEELIRGKEVWVVGNAPELADQLTRWRPEGIVVAADAASVVFKRVMGRDPDVVVTDLDGPVESYFEMSSVFVVHGHGDNMERMIRYVPCMGPVIPTTQVEPTGSVHNFGGFTDGDRAAFLAWSAGAKRINLLGMNFRRVNRYDVISGKNLRRKVLKLRIAEYLLKLLERLGAEVSWR